MTVDDYREFWADPTGGYALGHVDDSHEAFVILDQEEQMVVIIEDDQIYLEVVQRMLEAGVVIVGPQGESA